MTTLTAVQEGAPLLSVRDLRIHFATEDGVVRAVDGLTFAVSRGRTLGIVGESGSGKTVTAMALLGLHDPRQVTVRGEIRLDGRDLVGLSEGGLRAVRGGRIAMVFQDPQASLHPFYPVGKQICEAYRAHVAVSRRTAQRRAVDMLGRVGMPRPEVVVDSYPHELSGGMRQRVMIAMALVCEPDVLVADEPTTALDTSVQAQILALLQDLQAELRTAMVYISHDLAVVDRLADDVLVMYAGRGVEQGSAEQVLRAPRHPYTQGLLASIPTLHGDADLPLTPIPGSPPNLLALPAGCAFHPRCAQAELTRGRSFGEVPSLRPVPGGAGHLVACHLLDAPPGGVRSGVER